MPKFVRSDDGTSHGSSDSAWFLGCGHRGDRDVERKERGRRRVEADQVLGRGRAGSHDDAAPVAGQLRGLVEVGLSRGLIEDALEAPHLVATRVLPKVVELDALPDSLGFDPGGDPAEVLAVANQGIVKGIHLWVGQF